MRLFDTVKKDKDGNLVTSKAGINLYHVSSIEPVPENNNLTMISLTNGKMFCVKGNWAEINADISRKDYSRDRQ